MNYNSRILVGLVLLFSATASLISVIRPQFLFSVIAQPITTMPTTTTAPTTLSDGQLLAQQLQQARQTGYVDLNPGKTYRITQPAKWRDLRDAYVIGHNTTIMADFRDDPKTPEDETDVPVIDAVGAHRCVFRDFSITTAYNRTASCAMLLSRKPVGDETNNPSAGMHEFQRVTMSGTFKKVTFATFGSECNGYYNCQFVNSYVNGDVFLTDSQNGIGLKSPYGPIGGGSNVSHCFVNCQILHWAIQGGTQCLVTILQSPVPGTTKNVGQTEDVAFYRCDFAMSGPAKSGIYVNAGPIQRLKIDQCRMETGWADQAVLIDGGCIQLSITDSLIDGKRCAIQAEVLYDSLIARCFCHSFEQNNPAPAYVYVSNIANNCDISWTRFDTVYGDKHPSLAVSVDTAYGGRIWVTDRTLAAVMNNQGAEIKAQK